MVKISCSDFYLLVEWETCLRQPHGEGASLKRQSPCRNQRLVCFNGESPRAFSWEQLPQPLEIHTPWVSLPVSRSRVWKKGSSLQCRRGHGPLRNHHKRAEAFTSVKTCTCMPKWGRKRRRPQVEAGKEREQTARHFPSGPHSCQENGPVFSTRRKRQKGSASSALGTTACCRETLKEVLLSFLFSLIHTFQQ